MNQYYNTPVRSKQIRTNETVVNPADGINDDGSVNVKLSGSNVADAQSGLIPGMIFNGATFDRMRGNTDGILLANAARTGNVISPNQVNYNARGIFLVLKVVIASGTGGLSVVLQDANGIWLRNAPDVPLVTGVGIYGYMFYPGIVESTAGGVGTLNVVYRRSIALPRSFRVTVQAADSSSYTYSLEHSLIL